MLLKLPLTVTCLLMMIVGFSSACESTAYAASQITGSDASDSCLPFSMPDASALFASTKKVFAHYFYPFPLSVGNKSASEDYYNVHYLNKNGESGKWVRPRGFPAPTPLAGGSQFGAQLVIVKYAA